MKKILIISDCPTHPINAGNRMCINSYSKLLVNIGYDVYFLYISDSFNSNEYKETKQYWGDHFFSYKKGKIQLLIDKVISKYPSLRNYVNIDFYYPNGLSKFVRLLQAKDLFDGIIINYIWLSKLALAISNLKIALFTHDVFTYRNKKIGSNQWISCTPNDEAKCINRVNYVFAIQEKEAIYYSYLAHASNISVVYTPFFIKQQELIYNKRILFFSGANKLNLDGIYRFIDEIFPYLRNKIPDLTLHIGGGISNLLENAALEHKGIIVHGLFEDPSLFYQLGDIVINPVCHGSGLKIKTFEALSYTKSIISSTHSTQGIFEFEKAPIYIADNKEEYFEYIYEMFSNPEILMRNQKKAIDYLSRMNDYIAAEYKKVFG